MEEFGQQLKQTEEQLGQMSRESPELSPDQQRECLERLDKTMATLQKIRGGLVEAQERAFSGERLVQVIGLESRHFEGLDVQVFQRSFEVEAKIKLRNRLDLTDELERIPTRVSLVFETNYVPVDTGKLQKVDDIFLKFHRSEDVKYMLDKKEIKLVGVRDSTGCDTRVKFIQPSLNMDRRKTFREIGGLVDRLKAIEAEYTSIGAVRGCHDKPELGPGFLDRSWVEEQMPKWKRACTAGFSMDTQHFAMLRRGKIVNRAELISRIGVLHHEEKNVFLKLLEFKLNGFEFDF